MAFLDKVSGWFERMFDVPEDDDDVLDSLAADEGLLMTAAAVKGTPPVLPQMDTRPAPVAVDAAEGVAGDVATVVEELPAPASTRPAVKVVSLADLKDDDDDGDETNDDTAGADIDAPVVVASLVDVPEVDVPEVNETPDGETPPEEPAPHTIAAGDSAEKPNEGAMISASSSTEALLGAFKAAGEASEVALFTEGMENVPAVDLLAEARELIRILAPGGPAEDAA